MTFPCERGRGGISDSRDGGLVVLRIFVIFLSSPANHHLLSTRAIKGSWLLPRWESINTLRGAVLVI